MAQGTDKRATDQVGFTEEEKAAMREHLLEKKANKEDGEATLLAKVASMPEPDRSMAQRIHELVTQHAPGLMPKTWYGMPAYANKDGKAVCFFQAASKFKARYATFGFNDSANLDDGDIWPIYFAIKEMNPGVEAKLTELIKKAVQ